MPTTFKLIITLACFLTLLTACTSTNTLRTPRALEAATADTVTTAVVLAQGGHELNPNGLLGVLAAKAGYFILATPEERIKYDPLASQLWTTAAVSNALQLAFVGSAPVVFTLALSYIIVDGWFKYEKGPAKPGP